MKKTRILITILALLMLLGGMATVAYATDVTDTTAGNEVSITETNGTTTYYATIEAALAEQSSRCTLTLLTDVTTEATLSITTTMTIDLNGYDIKYVNNDNNATTASVLTVIGDLTLQDSNPNNRVRYGYWENGTYRITENDTMPTVSSGTTVDTLIGGVITGGTGTTVGSNNFGGGVYAPSGDFTMIGGNIVGNQATTGGGIYVGNFATITGGNIVGNQADFGGGVYVGSTMKLAGSPTVQDVYLKSGKVITLTGAYTGSVIPITTEDSASSTTPLTVVTTNSTYESVTETDAKYFTYTVTDSTPGSMVLLNGELKVVIWTYTLSEDGKTITASSDSSDSSGSDGGTITLAATDATYNGNVVEASVSKSNWIADTYNVGYVSGDTQLSSAPTNEGTYTASISMGNDGVVASVNYTISPATITVTADNMTAYVGDSEPSYTYTVTGLIGTDTFTTAPTLTSNANLSASGTYTITPSGGVIANYNIDYVTGVLTVKAKEDSSTDTDGSTNEDSSTDTDSSTNEDSSTTTEESTPESPKTGESNQLAFLWMLITVLVGGVIADFVLIKRKQIKA